MNRLAFFAIALLMIFTFSFIVLAQENATEQNTTLENITISENQTQETAVVVREENPFVEDYRHSFKEARTDNPSIPRDWFYSGNAEHSRAEKDLAAWRTDKYSISSESYSGQGSIKFNGLKPECCIGYEHGGFLDSRVIRIDPRKTYYLEAYVKTEVDWASFPVFYFDIFFENKDEYVSEFYLDFNETDISVEKIGKDFNPVILDFSDVGNGWKKIRVEISNLDNSIDNAIIEMAEFYEQQSVVVYIDDFSFYGV